MNQSVHLKGIREGLLLSVGEGPWAEVEQSMLQEIDDQIDFLRGAKLILDVENHDLNASTLGKLRDILSDRELSLWAVLSNSPVTEQTAQMLGLATKIHQAEPEQNSRAYDGFSDGDEALLVKRTLRSGNSIEFPGHITVIGDVNPGAEVVAGGSVVVWGRCRGMVHAGAEGDESAVVCALDLSPTQLRIAEKIAVSPQRREISRPEMAVIRDDQLIAQPWEIQGFNSNDG